MLYFGGMYINANNIYNLSEVCNGSNTLAYSQYTF